LFDGQDTRIRLALVFPVGRNEICTVDAGAHFACGLMGRASLQNFLARRSVVCAPVFLPPGERRAIVDARCRADDEDIAERQIRAGFAFPSPLAGDNYRDAMDEAKRQRAGVWAGPYDTPKMDLSEADARVVPFGSTRRSTKPANADAAHSVVQK
jgi:endonuclease YncB( thermonuclease family)